MPRGPRIPLTPPARPIPVAGPLTIRRCLAYPGPQVNLGDGCVADGTSRKTSRLKRLWPGRSAALPPAPRPPRAADLPEPLPPRTLTASELIAMARQARSAADERDPTMSGSVF